ncbi:hypothetical protein Poli38472_001672 [Pythium oligandrum]|uniref:Uncharacterized protein n=1 Tax=Pythium oligandrum TaxID=41045 RepID=A0A8K1CTE1_PYTOL|nr:hypothetical protein Poli38472_001672 [Pythium oligandrum]|eukprot:TMW69516.1 hypothetical protein Poli38472_001672 [Pythium oligandrum]
MMMEAAADNAVVPEETIGVSENRSPPDPKHSSSQRGEHWTQVKTNAASPATSTASNVVPVQSPGLVRGILRQVTALWHPSETREDHVRRRSHYRRGSILIKHLEDKQAMGKATEKDLKFFEMVKSQFDANIMESRTIISLSVFQTGSNPLDDPFAVHNMPLEIQQGFRRKLFAIFSLQLFSVVTLLLILSYAPVFVNLFEPAFRKWHFVFLTFVLMVIALLWLYLVKYRFPLNFFVLTLYTLTQSVFFAGFDYFFNTKASLFIFGFLFCIMAITTLICPIVIKRTRVPVDTSVTTGGDNNGNPAPTAKLIPYPIALGLSFFIAFIGSLFLYFFYMDHAVSSLQYSASLGAMFLLVMWFAYDASCMNERLSPDEYMQGMVFFYTDMVLFLLFLGIIFIACFACEGDCACYGTADIAPIGAGGADDEEDGDMIEEGEEGHDGAE